MHPFTERQPEPIRKARSFNEIRAAQKAARLPTQAEIDDMVRKAIAKAGQFVSISKTLPVQVERIAEPRSSSSIAVELASYIETKRQPGETVSAAWHRLSIDPKVTALYATYRDILGAEVAVNVGMNPATAKQAAIEGAAIEAEIDARASELQARSRDMTKPVATAKVLELDPGLYSRFLAAKMRQTGG